MPLFPDASRSLARIHVTQDRFDRLSGLETDTGFTLAHAIASGQAHADSSIGIYVGDAQFYDLFREVMEPIILDYHGLQPPIDHPAPLPPADYGSIALENPDPEGEFILSSRVRVARNLADVAFPPHVSAPDRDQVALAVAGAAETFQDDLAGHWFPMDKRTPEELETAMADGTAFPNGDRFMEDAGINRDFPRARGVFKSQDDCARIWVNEEDHLRVISMEKGADLASVFHRLGRMLTALERRINFARHPRLGYLSSCPTNIGTAMRAGVHIRLPRLEKHPEKLKKIVTAHQLQIRGTGGEKTAVQESVFDISNKHRLGLDEAQIIHTLNKGITALIAAEKRL